MTNELDDLEESFHLLSNTSKSKVEYELVKRRDRLWKEKDPVAYKKDMEDMCKAMFGDGWEREYDLLLREEFPEEFPDAGPVN